MSENYDIYEVEALLDNQNCHSQGMSRSRHTRVLQLSEQIINNARNSLIVKLRFLDAAMGRLRAIPENTDTIMVDGNIVFYDPHYVLRTYKENKYALTKQYLHMILHCVFMHFFTNSLVDIRLWGLACDIAVENCIQELGIEGMELSTEQRGVVEGIRHKIKYFTAEMIYRYLINENLPEGIIEHYIKLFTVDSHEAWFDFDKDEPTDEETGTKDAKVSKGSEGDGDYDGVRSIQTQIEKREELKNDWEGLAKRMQSELENFTNSKELKNSALTQNLREVNRERYDYTAFLKKFAAQGETMKVNDEEFDYVFYTYGLKLYENMPLIESLEYKDEKRIRDFVIAIDTSGSTKGELVQSFMQKTYNILCQSGAFFDKTNLHVIQCDNEIQEDFVIRNKEDFESYIKNVTIKGQRGTDFRPVFEYIEELKARKELKNLKGMIYFTDGYGIFPEQMPDYTTAFVFLSDGYNNMDVPVWAIKLILEPEAVAEWRM